MQHKEFLKYNRAFRMVHALNNEYEAEMLSLIEQWKSCDFHL